MIKSKIESEINVDNEDFSYFLMDLERRLGVKFVENDINSVGKQGKIYQIRIADLIKLVIEKIDLKPAFDCTTQSIFYKLRQFFINEKGISKQELLPNSSLEQLLPTQERKAIIAEIEDKLLVKTNILTIKSWLQILIALSFITGFIYLFIDIKIGFFVLLAFGLLSKIKGNELSPKTLGDFAKAIATQNYRTLRDRKGTFNPKEVENIIFELIGGHFGYTSDEIGVETRITW